MSATTTHHWKGRKARCGVCVWEGVMCGGQMWGWNVGQGKEWGQGIGQGKGVRSVVPAKQWNEHGVPPSGHHSIINQPYIW